MSATSPVGTPRRKGRLVGGLADARNQLTALLSEHIVGVLALRTAAKSGDQQIIEQRSDESYANGNGIAGLLHMANSPTGQTRRCADDERPPRPDPV